MNDMKQRDDTTKRPTPETDDNILDHTAPVWLCRKLERERDEARAVAKELQEALQHAWSYPLTGSWYGQATEALDNARKVLP